MQLLICSNIYNYVKGFKICEFNKNKIILFNPFLTNVPLMDKPGSWFLLAKCLKNTCGRVTFQVKMQVDDLHLYLKYHSAFLLKISLFSRCFWSILLEKPTTWFIDKWNIGRKWFNRSVVFDSFDFSVVSVVTDWMCNSN